MTLPDLAAFTRLLGVNVLHRSPERTEAELRVRADLCNRRGVLHGGAVMALGDTLGGMTASISLPDGGRTATIESKTNFFAAVPQGDTAHAVCMPLHRGRTTIVLETRNHPRRRQARRHRHADPADLRRNRYRRMTAAVRGRPAEHHLKAALRVPWAEPGASPRGCLCTDISDGRSP
jgi:1,4-dihydroxy-2-naphthoyl-CoA hydrolase